MIIRIVIYIAEKILFHCGLRSSSPTTDQSLPDHETTVMVPLAYASNLSTEKSFQGFDVDAAISALLFNGYPAVALRYSYVCINV